jgi:hypothetical protein
MSSISPIVDTNYRLLPADLQGETRRVVISNVTYQGVEEMTPVLHFAGQTKRLVLSPEQVKQMMEITGTVLYPRWIGTAILLQPPKRADEDRIKIAPVTSNQSGKPMPVYVSEDRRGWILAFGGVGIVLVVSLTVAALNFETLLATVEQLRDNWPLR